MDTIYRVNKDYLNTRIDRWVRKNICKIPQGLIEKNLRNQNITVNKLKVKSSYKLKSDDEIIIRNFSPKGRVVSQKKNTYLKKRRYQTVQNFLLKIMKILRLLINLPAWRYKVEPSPAKT